MVTIRIPVPGKWHLPRPSRFSWVVIALLVMAIVGVAIAALMFAFTAKTTVDTGGSNPQISSPAQVAEVKDSQSVRPETAVTSDKPDTASNLTKRLASQDQPPPQVKDSQSVKPGTANDSSEELPVTVGELRSMGIDCGIECSDVLFYPSSQKVRWEWGEFQLSTYRQQNAAGWNMLGWNIEENWEISVAGQFLVSDFADIVALAMASEYADGRFSNEVAKPETIRVAQEIADRLFVISKTTNALGTFPQLQAIRKIVYTRIDLDKFHGVENGSLLFSVIVTFTIEEDGKEDTLRFRSEHFWPKRSHDPNYQILE